MKRDLGEEGYAIATHGDNLFLMGGRRRGLVYAVFARWKRTSDAAGTLRMSRWFLAVDAEFSSRSNGPLFRRSPSA